ncbi:MAG: PAS domain S-box protein, partial [Gammaproteobacteria bacterium]|nr:PAS domain S-box protein [Gammaproteobacteria bacterium]
MNLFAGFYDLPPVVRYRRAAIAAAIVLMVYAAVQDASGVWDPMLTITRALTIGTLLALALATRYSPLCNRYLGCAVILGMIPLLGHTSLAILLHGLPTELVVTALLTCALISLVMHTSRLLGIHLLLWSAVPVAAAFATPNPQMNPVYFALSLCTESLFLYLIIGGTFVAKERLQRTDSVMGAMFNHATDALMYGHTQSAQVLSVNARALELFETNEPDEIAELTKQAFFRANRPLTPEQALRDIEHNETWQGTLPMRSASGREFWGDLTIRRIFIGKEDLMLIRISDVSDHIETEANLRRQELLLDNAQTMARVAGWELDVRSRRMYWTNTMYDMFGFERGIDPPKNVPELFADEDDYARIHAAMERCTKDGIGFDLETAIRNQGREMHIRYIAEPVFENGRLVRAIGVVSDISHRVRREAELNEARIAAEAAANARSQFLANMSHEIRTPMNGVIGMTSLLLNSNLNEEQHLQLETIRASGESLLAILNEILDFSKIDANHIELDAHEFDLEACVAEALEIVAPAAAEKNLELSMEMRGNPQRAFSGDVMRLRQILVNLLSNAVKFTRQGEV